MHFVSMLAWPVWAQALDGVGTTQTFEQVFGQRKARAVKRIAIPLWLDNQEKTLIDVELAGQDLRIYRKALQDALADILDAKTQEKLSVNDASWLTLSDLEQLELTASYDPARIVLQLSIPMSLRRTVDLSLNRRQQNKSETGREQVFTPLPWSLIVNSRWTHSESQSTMNATTVDDVLFADSALFISEKSGGWTVEHAGYQRFSKQDHYVENGRWVAQNTRVLRDWPEQQIRLNLGDLSTSAGYGMTPQDLTGIQINRQWSLNPRNLVQALPAHNLSLPAGAAVDVEVNGFIASSLRLGPGNYKISDIPLFGGANDVLLRIVEPGGKVRLYDLKYFFDAALLKPGLRDWSFAIGQARTLDATSRSPLITNGMLTQGITDSLTAGIGFQLQTQSPRPAYLWQFHSTWASAWGTWSQRWSQSQHLWGSAMSNTLQWSWAPQAGSIKTQGVAGSVQWTQTQKGYAPLDSQTPPSARQEIGVKLNFQLPQQWSGSWSWLHNRQNQQGQQVMAWATRKQLSQNWALDLSLQQQKIPAVAAASAQIPNRSYSVYIGLRYRAPPVPNATMQWQAKSQVTQFSGSDTRWQQDWTGQGSTSWSGGDAQWQTQMQQTQQGGQKSSLLQGELLTGRYHLGTSYNRVTQVNSNLGSPQRAFSHWESTLGSAFILSSYGVHISAPITDAAALFIPRKGYENLKLYVDPQQQTSAASADRWGMPVLSTLMSYNTRQLKLDIDPLPPGLQIGDALPWVEPGYRSVLAIPIGSDANTQIKGSLKNQDGQALGLTAIRLLRLATDGDKNTIDLFTNRKGQFTSPPLRPGNYTMLIPGESTALSRWHISSEEAGIKDLGTVQWQTSNTVP